MVAQTKLASLRRFKNISQREMGERIGITTASYSNKERGINQFTASEMFAIADIFEKELEEIFLNPNFIKREADIG